MENTEKLYKDFEILYMEMEKLHINMKNCTWLYR